MPLERVIARKCASVFEIELREEDGDDGARVYVKSNSDTYNIKDDLKAQGFKWNLDQREWYLQDATQDDLDRTAALLERYSPRQRKLVDEAEEEPSAYWQAPASSAKRVCRSANEDAAVGPPTPAKPAKGTACTTAATPEAAPTPLGEIHGVRVSRLQSGHLLLTSEQPQVLRRIAPQLRAVFDFRKGPGSAGWRSGWALSSEEEEYVLATLRHRRAALTTGADERKPLPPGLNIPKSFVPTGMYGPKEACATQKPWNMGRQYFSGPRSSNKFLWADGTEACSDLAMARSDLGNMGGFDCGDYDGRACEPGGMYGGGMDWLMAMVGL